jgi:dethiobiotin synthetase
LKSKLPERLFVTGIGTGVGKTLVAAVLTEALQADYWKPVQCGNLENSDAQLVQQLISNKASKIHPEVYRFKTASSPHYAAKIEGTPIEFSHFQIPQSGNRLIIEGAGGLMAPLSDKELAIDLIGYLKSSAVLVVRNYLGGINHTLLSIDALRQRHIPIAGIIFSGTNFLDNEEIILHFGRMPVLGRLDEAAQINKEFVARQGAKLKESISQIFEL